MWPSFKFPSYPEGCWYSVLNSTRYSICLGFAVVVCQINITRTSSSNCCINIPFSVARFDKLYSDTLVEPSKVKLLINTIISDDRPRKIRSQTCNLWTDAATVVGRGCFREGRKVGCRLAKEAGAEPGWASKKCTRLWREATSRSTFRIFQQKQIVFRIRKIAFSEFVRITDFSFSELNAFMVHVHVHSAGVAVSRPTSARHQGSSAASCCQNRALAARCVCKALQQRVLCMYTNIKLWQQGDGVCFRCLHSTKTHLSHSGMDWGRSIHVPANFSLWSRVVQGLLSFISSSLQSAQVYGKRPSREPPCIFTSIIVMSCITCDLWLIWNLESWFVHVNFMTLLTSSLPVLSLWGVSICVCKPFLHRAWYECDWICRGHAAIMQTHANEAMHDGGSRGWPPWCTCSHLVELLISISVQCCTVFPFTHVFNSVGLALSRPQLGLREEHPLLEPASSLKISPVYLCRRGLYSPGGLHTSVSQG